MNQNAYNKETMNKAERKLVQKNGENITAGDGDNIYINRKKQKINLADMDAREKLKYEIAEDLGLLDQVLESGWKSLTSKETGRIGGLITKKLYRKNAENESQE